MDFLIGNMIQMSNKTFIKHFAFKKELIKTYSYQISLHARKSDCLRSKDLRSIEILLLRSFSRLKLSSANLIRFVLLDQPILMADQNITISDEHQFFALSLLRGVGLSAQTSRYKCLVIYMNCFENN